MQILEADCDSEATGKVSADEGGTFLVEFKSMKASEPLSAH